MILLWLMLSFFNFYSQLEQIDDDLSIAAVVKGPKTALPRCLLSLQEAFSFVKTTLESVSPGCGMQVLHLSPSQMSDHEPPTVRYNEDEVRLSASTGTWLAKGEIRDDTSQLMDQLFLSGPKAVSKFHAQLSGVCVWGGGGGEGIVSRYQCFDVSIISI